MTLTLAYSPCPNDTFIFDAMVHGRIDTEGLRFEEYLGDVEELNREAMEGHYDITKLSYHALGYLTDRYQLLHSGSALGRGVGPLLISRGPMSPEQIATASIAVPGRYTTAAFLLSLAYPGATDWREYLFSDIEDAVLSGEVDAGLLIHENRFTYAERGLHCLRDLGDYWEQATGQPIPLGGIVVRRDLPDATKQRIDRVLARSVAYAFEHPEHSLPYVKEHAQAMDATVMQRHIALYVNEFTQGLGEEGRSAVHHLLTMAADKGIIPEVTRPLLVPGGESAG